MKTIEQRIQEAEQTNRVASFIVPVKEGAIFLTERVKEPYKGFYCATGGKRIYRAERYETPEETALREFCEEEYSRTITPEALEKYNIYMQYFGFIFDDEFGFICHASIACLDEAPEVVLKQDEVRRKRKLEEIKPDAINPITQHMLQQLRYMSFNYMLDGVYEPSDFLFTQIPHFSKEYPFDVPTKKYCSWQEQY